MKSLLKRLTNQSNKQLEELPDVSTAEYESIIEKISQWGAITWKGKNVHVVTMCSFALGLIENSEFTYPNKIIKTLSDIVDYYDRVGKAPGICMFGGGVAADKWTMIMDN